MQNFEGLTSFFGRSRGCGPFRSIDCHFDAIGKIRYNKLDGAGRISIISGLREHPAASLNGGSGNIFLRAIWQACTLCRVDKHRADSGDQTGIIVQRAARSGRFEQQPCRARNQWSSESATLTSQASRQSGQ